MIIAHMAMQGLQQKIDEKNESYPDQFEFSKGKYKSG
jgi:hypothetical protein